MVSNPTCMILSNQLGLPVYQSASLVEVLVCHQFVTVKASKPGMIPANVQLTAGVWLQLED